MTGRNAHAVGMGQVAHIDAGFPGYTGELPEHQPSMAEMFRANGYATLAVGKWHLCKNADLSEAGDKHSWPLQRGFDQYYGFLEALTNFHHPHRMYEGNAVVDTDQYPDGYYLTDDLTDRAVRMIREVKTADPAQAVLPVLRPRRRPRPAARQARRHRSHPRPLRRRLGRHPRAPPGPPDRARHHARRHRAATAQHRARRGRRRLGLAHRRRADGVRPLHGVLRGDGPHDRRQRRRDPRRARTPRRSSTTPSSSSPATTAPPARDASSGSIAYFRDASRTAGLITTVDDDALARLDEIGGPTTWPHYPRGWAMACNTPFRLYKISTFRGGHSVPFVVSWPARIAADQIVRTQYTHVTDVLPTLAQLIGVDAAHQPQRAARRPARRRHLRPHPRRRRPPRRPTPSSTTSASATAPTTATAGTPSPSTTPASRSARTTGTCSTASTDVNELDDLADQHPERVAELVDAWEQAAWQNQVFPLDEGTGLSKLMVPPFAASDDEPLRILPGTPTLERYRSSRLISRRTFSITVDWDHQPGDQGILVAHGGQEGGYVLWVEDDQLGFEVNAYGTPRPVGRVPLPGRQLAHRGPLRSRRHHASGTSPSTSTANR